jgi:hypothetical protein
MNYKNIVEETLQKSKRKSYAILEKNQDLVKFLNDKYPNISDFKTKIYLFVHDIDDYPICKNTGCPNPVSFKNRKFNDYCSPTCFNDFSKKSGRIDQIVKKRKQTNLEKYGNEVPSKLNIFKEKSKKTNIDRYGVPNPSKSSDIREKAKLTNLERYGVENPATLEYFKEKAKQTNLEKYKTTLPNKSHYNQNFQNVLNDKNIFQTFLNEHGTYSLAEIIGCHISTIHHTSKKFDIPLPPRPRSNLEDTFENFLNINKIKFQSGSRRILPSGKELDFYFPEHNLAVEINGLYWHSEISGGKDRKYHYNKWKECDDLGITLLSIQEDEFNENKQFWFNKILYMTGNMKPTKIHARKCEIRELDNVTKFLNEHHLQGSCASSYKFGLFYDDNLVSVMTFSNTRNNDIGIIELSRFCNHSGYLVSGGASKLLSHFIKKYGHLYKSIISFSDNNYSNGKVYETLGFDLKQNLRPDYKYVINQKRQHKANFRKSSIFKKFDIPDDMKNKSEWELMQYLGYDRIWDTGKKKWEMKI